MSGVNKVILIGNLGKDPEIKYFENNIAKVSFSLATTEYYKDKNGQKTEQTEWHNIVMWRGLAENASKLLKKGSQIYLEGKIQSKQWIDKEGNKKNINYMLPILFCSSPEISAELQPELVHTQDWATSVFHELYHQYQFKETAIYNYLNSFIKQNRMLTKDSMQSIYENNWSFKDSLIKENDLLLKAINAKSIEEEKKYFTEFLKTRTKRRSEFYKQKKITIGPIEEIWEKLEGTALYIDAILKENFAKIPVNEYLLTNDKYYKKENIYDGYSINTAKDYTSITDAKHYFGATGVNLVRLLEKNNVDYKTNFFKYASMPLSTQLKYFYKIK